MNERELPSAESLAERFVKNDAEALDLIAKRFLTPALGAAREILSDHALAEDAVQEAFLRVVRCRTQYDASRPFSTWFYSILRNVCRDMLRRRVREAKAMTEIGSLRPTASEPAGESGGSGISAVSILSCLPEAERAVLTLRIVHDLPFCDVAAALGVSCEAAKKRAQRGLSRLRRRAPVDEALR